MAYCAFLDGCRYYQPVTRLIMFCLGLGLGNSSSEALFHGGRYHERYQDVLLPGGAFWDENHPTDVAQLFVCHSIVERFKLEVFWTRTSPSHLNILRTSTRLNQPWLASLESLLETKALTVNIIFRFQTIDSKNTTVKIKSFFKKRASPSCDLYSFVAKIVSKFSTISGRCSAYRFSLGY